MTLLAVDFPPFEYVIILVAVLVGLIGKVVDFAKKVREKSIEAEKQADAQYGMAWGEAPEPPDEEPRARLELARRPPRPRHEEPSAVTARPPPKPPVVAPPPKARQHPIARMLRSPHDVRKAVVLAEVLGRPKGLRRGR